jgi:thymidine kinase
MKNNTLEYNGKLEVICGSMFSGKSEELIRRIRRASYTKQVIQIFKHSFDNERGHSVDQIQSHGGNAIQAISVSSANEISLHLLDTVSLVGIDEIQFFDYDVILLINRLVSSGKQVIVAGLDLDFKGIPFGVMPHLLALADDVTKLKAICTKTGKDAHFSQRLIDGRAASYNDKIVLVGAKEYYEARSREAYEIDYTPLAEYIEQIRLKK